MTDKKAGRIILTEAQVREGIMEGMQATFDVVSTTFGPRGRNVIWDLDFGRPIISRDGVAAARQTYFSDRNKQLGASILLEAAETTNRNAGDATTGTTVLSYHLYSNGLKAIAAGVHPMEIEQIYRQDSYKLLARLDELAVPIGEGQLTQVATVASGDENLGKMIASAIEKVGTEGGIIAEKASTDSVECQYIDGYYLQSGFQALEQGKKELIDPMVIVSIRRLSSRADAIELITKSAQVGGLKPGNVPRLLFIGNIEDAAYFHIVQLINQGLIDAIVLKTPPAFGEMGKQLLEDIAYYADCQPLTDSMNIKDFGERHIGTVDRATASKTESTLFANNSTEEVRDRVQAIRDQISEETVPAILDKLKDRVSKLEGKIALIRIGAATDTSKEELEYRIEDALNATRAAAEFGVVPGGGVTLLELSKLDISEYYRNALQDTFKQLLINANLPAELALYDVLKEPFGTGYDLRVGNRWLVDLAKAGVLDPKLAVQQVITNSTEAIAKALTIGVGLTTEVDE